MIGRHVKFCTLDHFL